MHLRRTAVIRRKHKHTPNTRRQLLTTGALGLLGMAVAGTPKGRAASGASAEPEQEQLASSGPHVLQPGEPSDVGMSPERLQRISDRLQTETSDGGITSASILVARHGKVVLHRGFGKLNQHPDAPTTKPDTVYLLASISKPVSVCGLMLLVERGQVVLSDPVQRYLPDFQGGLKEQVTVQHLLSHTSGLPDMLPENVVLRRAHAPLSEFVAGALRVPLRYAPGTSFGYQSMGTLLAAAITERLFGERLRDVLRREIFQPLNMNRTVLGLNGLRIEETAIFQERDHDTEDSRRWGPNSPYWRDMGHPWGGLHSTTGDLAILLQTFLNGGLYDRLRLFSVPTTVAMTRDHNGALDAPWGLGWALRDSLVWNYFGDLGTAGTFGHVGATGTVAWADPEKQLLCILLSTRAASHQQGFLLNSVSNMVQAAVIR